MSLPIETTFSLPSLSSPEQASVGLRRKDSRHAMTTCHGVTTHGRACRRAIKSVKQNYSVKGTILILHGDEDAACFFCWQHKEQADQLASQLVNPSDKAEAAGRISLAAASREYAIDEAEDHVGRSERHVAQSYCAQAGLTSAGRLVDQTQPGLTSTGRLGDGRTRPSKSVATKSLETRARRQPGSQKGTFLSIFAACLSPVGKQTDLPARPKPRPYHHQPAISQMPENARGKGVSDKSNSGGSTARMSGNFQHVCTSDTAKQSRMSDSARKPRQFDQQHVDEYHDTARRRATLSKVDRDRHVAGSGPVGHSRTQSASSNIRRRGSREHREMAVRSKSSPYPNSSSLPIWPPELPRPASDTMRISYAKLLNCMSEKNTGRKDEGFIYMFWQTELPMTAAETQAAVNLVVHQPSNHALARSGTQILQRRLLQTSSTAPATKRAPNERKICLKIGRAANVHQRMDQWRKQCGYNICLLKYYPSLNDGHDELVRIPYVAKIERLVHLHLEMLGYRVKKECRCGTEHREWFEIQATHDALQEIDGIIRQWISWYRDRCAQS